MGLRFAGSGDTDARDAALNHVSLLLRLCARGAADLAGATTLELCTAVCLLAAGMVSGKRVLRLVTDCIYLRLIKLL